MKTFVAVITIASFLFAPQFARAEEPAAQSNLTFIIGKASINDWKVSNDHTVYGLEADYNPGSWPVNAFGRISSSNASENAYVYIPGYGTYNVNYQTKITEISLGARKYFDLNNGMVRPHLSAGVSNVSVELTPSISGLSLSASDSSTGFFGDAGVRFTVDRFFAGVNFRILTGTGLSFWGASTNANYTMWGVTFGIKL
ncbi:MAG: hypothetical protein HZB29_04750 [Nitrospinae bacterium]|nr:hypothetical protein [Nitrospinota bacterium]